MGRLMEDIVAGEDARPTRRKENVAGEDARSLSACRQKEMLRGPVA